MLLPMLYSFKWIQSLTTRRLAPRKNNGTESILRCWLGYVNSSFPSSPRPLFQNEGRCSVFDMEIIFHSHANKTHFHKKGCALGLILKVRVFGTQKWPIVLNLFLGVVIKLKSNSWDGRTFNPLSTKCDQWNKLRTYQSPLQTYLFFSCHNTRQTRWWTDFNAWKRTRIVLCVK